MTFRDATGHEVFPENPPGHVFVGDLHLLDFFAQVMTQTRMLLTLPIWPFINGQWAMHPRRGSRTFRWIGSSKCTSLGPANLKSTDCPWSRMTTVEVLPETWEIVRSVGGAATELRAVVFEASGIPWNDVFLDSKRYTGYSRAHPLG